MFVAGNVGLNNSIRADRESLSARLATVIMCDKISFVKRKIDRPGQEGLQNRFPLQRVVV